MVTWYWDVRQTENCELAFLPALSKLVQMMSIRVVLLGREFLPQATRDTSCSGRNPRVSRSPGRWPPEQGGFSKS